MEDNKNPKGGGAKRRPLWGGVEGAALLSSIWYCKDFLCFGIIPGAHSGSMLAFPPFFWEGLFQLPRFSQKQHHQAAKF